jgi:hypothetical protein
MCSELLDGRIAQLGERWPYKPEVIGSSPVPPTICGAVVQSGLTRWPVKPEIAGSIPVSPAIFLSFYGFTPEFSQT